MLRITYDQLTPGSRTVASLATQSLSTMVLFFYLSECNVRIAYLPFFPGSMVSFWDLDTSSSTVKSTFCKYATRAPFYHYNKGGRLPRAHNICLRRRYSLSRRTKKAETHSFTISTTNIGSIRVASASVNKCRDGTQTSRNFARCTQVYKCLRLISVCHVWRNEQYSYTRATLGYTSAAAQFKTHSLPDTRLTSRATTATTVDVYSL